MRFFDFSNIKGDVFGGITAGIVALPLALAFGVQSGLGAIYGLYGAIALGIIASLLGGTPAQVSGPTGPMTVISATVIAAGVAMYGSIETAFGFIVASFLLCGVFQVIMGVLGVGKVIRFIPYSVLSGFMSGIGVIICLYQLMPAFGLPSASSAINVITQFPSVIGSANWNAFLLTVITITIIYTSPKISKAVPSALVALIVATLLAYFTNMDVAKIGTVPEGLPVLLIDSLTSLTFSDLLPICQFGLMLAALGAIDSLLTSIVADNITKTQHDSKKELIGQGVGNVAASLIGGIPGAGATMRTVINVKSGGKTPISGIIHGIFLLVVLLGAGPLASEIPLSVLAGILITVGIGIIDYKGIKQVLHIPRTDAAVLILVLLVTVFGNLLYAVAIGTVLACLSFMVSAVKISEQNSRLVSLSHYPDPDDLWPDEKEVVAAFGHEIYFKHLHGPLFFGFAHSFKSLVASMPDIRWVVIRMENVPYLDQSGAYAFEEALIDLNDRGINVALCGLNEESVRQLKTLNIVPSLLSEEKIFNDVKSCSRFISRELKSTELTSNALSASASA